MRTRVRPNCRHCTRAVEKSALRTGVFLLSPIDPRLREEVPNVDVAREGEACFECRAEREISH